LDGSHGVIGEKKLNRRRVGSLSGRAIVSRISGGGQPNASLPATSAAHPQDFARRRVWIGSFRNLTIIGVRPVLALKMPVQQRRGHREDARLELQGM
jgi:hypothetical protein